MPDVLHTKDDFPPSIEAETILVKSPQGKICPVIKKEPLATETSNIFEHLPAENVPEPTSENLDTDSPPMDLDSSNLKKNNLDSSDQPVLSSQTVKKEAVYEHYRQLKIVKSSGSSATKFSEPKSNKTSTISKIKAKL